MANFDLSNEIQLYCRDTSFDVITTMGVLMLNAGVVGLKLKNRSGTDPNSFLSSYSYMAGRNGTRSEAVLVHCIDYVYNRPSKRAD